MTSRTRGEMSSTSIEFFKAIRYNDYKKVKEMLKQQMVGVNDLDLHDPDRPSAIIIAAEFGHVEIVHRLMKAKPKPADINVETRNGKRAIWWAAKCNNLPLTKELLSKRTCEVNYVDKESGYTPLYRAIVGGYTDIARELVHAGADVNARRLGLNNSSETTLMKAVQLDNMELCELLINSLCKIQAKNDDGLTALHFAVAYRRYDICDFLLKNGVKVQASTNHGVTAMTVAIEQHNPYMVRLLIEYGYRINKSYKWGEAPLEQAIRIHSQECALTLLHWGCSLKRKKKQRSYFHLALNEKQWLVVRFLIHLNPNYLQEEWLWNDKWPVSIYRRPDVREFLKESAKTAWTLKQLCRSKVFGLVGKYAPIKMDKLPLPETLKDYLKFNEHVKEQFYTKKPLDTVDCPFDCFAICPLRRCPDLDISVSSDTDSEFEI